MKISFSLIYWIGRKLAVTLRKDQISYTFYRWETKKVWAGPFGIVTSEERDNPENWNIVTGWHFSLAGSYRWSK